ncbi:hypothetical protein PYS61_06340 [Amygdalobacter indicium]|uniref:Uncharacterized protein n=1 Tax=Amygdalobacter indicium TaxID=3029272 RepID=A0ABY8C6H6_9FIRM|nr:hypothetical protein [Amygdalobacter indicium]WEG35539.1 hypothetical protein PYS61_06340 [Amygdalobacter indicium]
MNKILEVDNRTLSQVLLHCLVLQAAEEQALNVLMEKAVPADCLSYKLSQYNYCRLLSEVPEQLLPYFSAYQNFAYLPPQLLIAVANHPACISAFLQTAYNLPLPDFYGCVADFEACSTAKLQDLRSRIPEEFLNLLAQVPSDTTASEKLKQEYRALIADLSAPAAATNWQFKQEVLQAQADYNCTRFLVELADLIFNRRQEPLNLVYQAVSAENLHSVRRILSEQYARLLPKFGEIAEKNDSLSQVLLRLTAFLAAEHIQLLEKLTETVLGRLKQTASKNVLLQDERLLAEIQLLFTAYGSLGDVKLPSASELTGFIRNFSQIFDLTVSTNSGNMYIAELIIDCGSLTLARRLRDYLQSNYTATEILESEDLRDWLRVLTHYSLPVEREC